MLVIKEQIENIQQVKAADIIIQTIYKREILEKDYTKVSNNIKMLIKAKKDAREKLIIIFDGYDNDIREIYMIQEIRNYINELYNKYPFMFYFISSLDNNNKLLLACLNDYRTYKKDNDISVALEIIKKPDIYQKIISSTIIYGDEQNDLENTKRLLYSLL